MLVAAVDDNLISSSDSGFTCKVAGAWAAPVTAILEDKQHAGELLVGTAGLGVFRGAIDRADGWTALKSPALVYSLAFDGGGTVLMAASIDGVHESHDRGETWDASELGPISCIVGGAWPATIAVGLKGVFTRAQGTRWRSANNGLHSETVFSLLPPSASNPSILIGAGDTLYKLAGSQLQPFGRLRGCQAVYSVARTSGPNGGLLVGCDGGLQHASPDALPIKADIGAVFAVVTDVPRPGLVMAASRTGLWQIDVADRRAVLSVGGIEGVLPISLAASVDRAAIYLGSVGRGIFRSGDGGKSWQASGDELSRMTIRCISVGVGNPGAVFAGTDNGLYVSEDGGAHWTPWLTAQTSGIVYSVALDQTGPSLVLYAGTSRGLFSTRDKGKSWTLVGSGSLGVVFSVGLDANRKRLFIASVSGLRLFELSEHE